MFKELVIAFAEVVQSLFSISSADKTILRALSVTGEKILALKTLARKRIPLRITERLLLLAIHHLDEGILTDIAKLILRENEMIAGIDIPVVFHHTGVTTGSCHGTDSRLLPHPVCKGGIKELDIVLPDIIVHPFVKYCTKEIAPLLRLHTERRERKAVVVRRRGQMASVRMRHESLHNRRELDIAAADILEKTVELQRMVPVEIVDNGKGIPLNAIAVQDFYSLHDLGK